VIELIKYGFKSDPFPLVPEASVTHWAGREEIKREVVDVIESVRVIDVGTSEFAILHGEYGAGKSHALRYLATTINELRKQDFRSRAIYLPTIRIDQKVSFLGLYKTIVEQLGNDFIEALATQVRSGIDKAEQHLKDSLPKDEIIALMAKPDALRLRAIEGIAKEDRPMVRLLDELAKGTKDVARHLRGENKHFPDWGISSPIDTDFAAVRALGALLRVMTIQINNQEPPCLGAYIFLDECEAITEMKVAESGPLLNSIRELVNQVPYNFCLLLGFSAEAALIEAVVPQAILQRLSRPYIEFPPLQADEAKTFLIKHFLAYRPDGFALSNPYHPFAEATIELVLEQITEMTPRNIFRKLRTVLERAIRRFDLKPGEEISPGLAEQILTH
jgi:hypothetical protein